MWFSKMHAGNGFAFRREGFAVVLLEGGKVVRQRHFFENERVTFKEVLAPGDGRTFPQVTFPPFSMLHELDSAYFHFSHIATCSCVTLLTQLAQIGQRAVLRYTEFTSNECLPDAQDASTGERPRSETAENEEGCQ